MPPRHGAASFDWPPASQSQQSWLADWLPQGGGASAPGFSLGSLFAGSGQPQNFGLFGDKIPNQEPLTIEGLLSMPGNEECADCGAMHPDWASTNQGTVICIDCAGVHRSLGAHISKVKSLRLDAWKSEEILAFRALGGNTEVNSRLAKRASRFAPSTRNASYPAFLVRPDMSGGKPDISEYIRKKYHAMGPPEASYGSHDMGHQRSPYASGPAAAQGPAAGTSSAAGRTCLQGVCFVEIMGIEISEERARDLRMLGQLFLSLNVTMSLGTITAEASSVKRGSAVASWDPPERRELLWDCEERWLWCRVFDGSEIVGMGQMAAEGRVDLGLLGDASNVEVCVDLFARGGDDSDDEKDQSRRGIRWQGNGFGAPAGYFAEGKGRRMQRAMSMDQDPQDPSVYGQCCGVARLRVTLVNMSGMDSSAKLGRANQSQGQSQGQTRQNERSAWDFWPRDGLPALLGFDRASRPS